MSIDIDTVGGFNHWRQKDGDPGTVLVPLKLDISTYENELAEALCIPVVRISITGTMSPEAGPSFFFGGAPGLPIVSEEQEAYVLGLAAELENRLRAAG